MAEGPSSGTSFAAPHVTGAIALMMDRSSTLKAHPELVRAILQATADISNLDLITFGSLTRFFAGT